MFVKLFILFLSFILCFLGLEIYRNTALMDRGYLLQRLEVEKTALIEENGYLQERLSPYLSLNRLEDYARKELGLVNPEKVRFLEGNFSPPEVGSSPPSFDNMDKFKKRLKSLYWSIVGQIGRGVSILYEKKEQ